MTEQEAPTTPEPEATAEAVLNHPGGQSAGGKYAVVAAETVDLNGTPLRIRTRADGQLWGWIADPRVKGGRRAFVSTKGDRAEVIARATEVVEGRGPAPKVVRRRKASGAATPTNPETPATTPETAPSDPEPVIGDRHAPEPTERRNGGPRPSGGVWAAAYVDPADYPVARALDELDRLVVPAIEALRAAGKADAAELVKAELGRTPAEEELLRLYQEVMSRPRLGG